MKIEGTFTEIVREKHLPPNDGVHVASNYDGYLKGSHGIMCGNKLVPKGVNGFYWQQDDKFGVKVFLALDKGWTPRLKTIKSVLAKHWKLFKADIAVKPYGVVDVFVDIKYRNKRIKQNAFGIKTRHVRYPTAAWLDYCRGRPYQWGAVHHPMHTPEKFLEFQKAARKYTPSSKVSLKLGDVVYDMTKNRWYQVDVA